MRIMRGVLIALEGLDRTGKSTQIAELERFLRAKDRSPVTQKFPERTTVIGRHIDSFLKAGTAFGAECAHLLFTINRWEVKPQIEELLGQGHDVLLDRYLYSGIAYSHAKGLPFDWCATPERGLPAPDLVVYLRPHSVEELAGRGNYGEEIYERIDFQQRVHHVYESLLLEPSWAIIDAGLSPEEVSVQIGAIVDELLKNFNNKPLAFF